MEGELTYYRAKTPHDPQADWGGTFATWDHGRALLVIGGKPGVGPANNCSQIVRPHEATQTGPCGLKEGVGAGCATNLGDGSIIITGGQTDPEQQGSRKVQVYNVTTEIWEDRADMNHARLYHSCTQVSVTSTSNPFIKNMGNDSVTSVIVVGGKKLP